MPAILETTLQRTVCLSEFSGFNYSFPLAIIYQASLHLHINVFRDFFKVPTVAQCKYFLSWERKEGKRNRQICLSEKPNEFALLVDNQQGRKSEHGRNLELEQISVLQPAVEAD